MTDTNTVEFTEDGKPILPSAINILTILTFIGSGLSFIFILLTPFVNKFFAGIMDKASSSGAELTAKQLADMEKGKAIMELTASNMVPLMAIGLVSVALCVVGAFWMRKLKKDGLWIYIGGELLPLIGNFILLGTDQFTGFFSVFIAIALPLIFIVLYFRQIKYLIR